MSESQVHLENRRAIAVSQKNVRVTFLNLALIGLPIIFVLFYYFMVGFNFIEKEK